MIIYLCGPMTGKTPEKANEWRNRAIAILMPYGFILTNPLRVESNYIEAHKKIAADGFGEESPYPEMRPSAIYHRDMFDVRQADLILANMNDAHSASLGSSHELGYADALEKMIILVARPGNIYREHPITSKAANILFDELDPALEYIKVNYAPYVQERV